MDVEWIEHANGVQTAEIGPYTIQIEPPDPEYGQVFYTCHVYVGDKYKGYAAMSSIEEARRLVLDSLRPRVAELARAFGLIDQEWISVDERLPPIGTPVLVYIAHAQYRDITDGVYYDNGDGWSIALGNTSAPDPTHWRPLPPPPDEGEVTT